MPIDLPPLVQEELSPDGGAHPAGVLVLLHGRGADEHDLEPAADHLGRNLRRVLLRAPLPWGPGWQWYSIDGALAPARDSWDASLQALSEAVARIRAASPAAPLILGGFSQGAALAAGWTAASGDRPDGLALFSGYLAPLVRPASLADLPVFVGHGRADPVLPIENGRALTDAFHHMGARVTARDYDVGHGLAAGEMVDAAAWIREILEGRASGEGPAG